MDPVELSMRDIIKKVAAHYSVAVDRMVASSQYRGTQWRTAKVVEARQVAMYLCREYIGATYVAIGEAFRCNHSTVIVAWRRIRDQMPQRAQTVADDVLFAGPVQGHA